jgi:hypothetical protein
MGPPSTLDEAMSDYEQAAGPNVLTAGYLLLIATKRWQADRMSDEAYHEIVMMVARDLIQQGEK